MDSSSKTRLLYCIVVFGACCTLGTAVCEYGYFEAERLELVAPRALLAYRLLADLLCILLACAFLYFVLSRAPRGGAIGPAFRLWVDTSSHGLAFVDARGVLGYANPVFLRMFRLSSAVHDSARFEAIISDYLHREDRARLLPSEIGEEIAFDLRPPAGQPGSIKLWVRKLPGAEASWVIRTRNTSEEWALGKRGNFPSLIPDISMDAVVVIDILGDTWPIIYVNAAFEEMTGYASSEIIGQNYRILQGRNVAQRDPQFPLAFEGGRPANLVVHGCRRDGSVFHSRLRVAPVYDSQASATYVVGVFHDLTEVQALEEALDSCIGLDPLTMLPNRLRFKPALESMLANPEKAPVLVVQFNIRRFQETSAAHGDAFCHALLVQVAERLSKVEGAIAARTGDCEFALATTVPDRSQADAQIGELWRLLGATYVLPGSVLDIGFAIGYTVGANGTEADLLLRQAGIALFKAQAPGLPGPQSFDAGSDMALRQRTGLMRDLQQALGSGEFVLNFQPRVDLATGMIIGAEALLRWHHPVFGMQSPDRFLAAIEESGLILEIGDWAIGAAAEFAVSLNRGRVAPLLVGINLSAAQVVDRGLLTRLDRVIARTGADPAWFTMEITESVFAGPGLEFASMCQGLRARGFGLAIDDFATACSSLRQLDAFPLTEMKIDLSFVRDLDSNRYRQAVVGAAVAICQELEIAVTAEGVESDAEWRALQRLECRFGQGFLFSVPLAASEFTRLLACDPALPVRCDVVPHISAA